MFNLFFDNIIRNNQCICENCVVIRYFKYFLIFISIYVFVFLLIFFIYKLKLN